MLGTLDPWHPHVAHPFLRGTSATRWPICRVPLVQLNALGPNAGRVHVNRQLRSDWFAVPRPPGIQTEMGRNRLANYVCLPTWNRINEHGTARNLILRGCKNRRKYPAHAINFGPEPDPRSHARASGAVIVSFRHLRVGVSSDEYSSLQFNYSD